MKRRVVQTKRDRKIISFLEQGFIGTSEMIDRLFFNSPVSCRRRLARMTEKGWIDRVRADESTPYIYFAPQHQKKVISTSKIVDSNFKNETEQNKQLYLTQCLAEMTQLGDLVFYAKQYTLTSSIADLLAVVEMNGTKILAIADIFNRDGNGERHKNFLNNSIALNNMIREYEIEFIAHIIFAERITNTGDSTFFIPKKTGFSYRDYKEIDWSRTTHYIRHLISSNK